MVRMKKTKPEIDNTLIQAKYQSSRERVKYDANRLLKTIEKELDKLASIKDKFSMNEFNEKLLNKKLMLISDFRDEFTKSWKYTLKGEEY
jgi:peroxiredoxin